MSDLRAELDALMAAARHSLESRYSNQCELAAVFDRDNPLEIAEIASFIRSRRSEPQPLGDAPPLPHEMTAEVPPIEARYSGRRIG